MDGRTYKQQGNILLYVLIIAVVVVAGVIWWAWWQRQNNPSPSVASVCTNLSLSQGTSNGAAGTIYKNSVITNMGSMSCTITGYPAVFMLDSHGMQVGSGAAANSLYAVAAITLAPGGKAHSVVAYPQQPNFPAGTCSSIGSTMKLYVPGVVMALTTPWSDYSCPGFSATAFQPGA